MGEGGWKAAGAAEMYMKKVEAVAPGRAEILDIIARLAVAGAGKSPRIMDIGCGWGNVTQEVLKHRPEAVVVMSDYSPEMIEICQDRFRDNENISVRKVDLNAGLANDDPGQYDAIVSCFALHHVEPGNRVGLYAEIRRALKPGGLFINGDLFICSSPTVNNWEFDSYVEWMRGRLKERLNEDYTFAELKSRQLETYRVMGDMPGTVWEMQRDLLQAGFEYVDCLCKYQNLAVLAACSR